MKSNSILKKILLAALLCISLTLLFTACGDTNEDTPEKNSDDIQNIEEDEFLILDSIGADELSYLLNNDGTAYSVIGYWGDMWSRSVTIPEEYNGLPVSAINESAFSSDIYLESIYIPDSVTSIGDHVFDGCASLKSIRIPSNLSSVGIWAFDSCDLLEYTEYENAIYLGNETNPYIVLLSAKSTDITECTVHEDTRIVYDYAFADCTELEKVTINAQDVIFGENVFINCYDLEYNEYDNALYLGSNENPYIHLVSARTPRIEACEIHADTRSIGVKAFDGCDKITSINIPSSVVFIGAYAFNNCTALEDVAFESTEKWSVCPFGQFINSVVIDTPDNEENASRLTEVYYYCNFHKN